MKLEGYSNYEIYPETGKIYSYTSNRYIGAKHPKGYIKVHLTDDYGNTHNWLVHRLIWTIVNGEIPDDMEVNHIDENKTNNSIFNLNLLSHKENCNWGTYADRMSKVLKNRNDLSKSIIGLQNGIIIMFFPSIQDAGRNGFKQQNICKCLKGKRNQTGGYGWMYLDNYLADWWEQEMEKGA